MINLRHTYFLPFFGGGTLFSLDPSGCSNFESSLLRPSNKCQRTHIIQNLFHVISVLPLLNSASKDENSDFFLTTFKSKCRLFFDFLVLFLIKNLAFVVISKMHWPLCNSFSPFNFLRNFSC